MQGEADRAVVRYARDPCKRAHVLARAKADRSKRALSSRRSSDIFKRPCGTDLNESHPDEIRLPLLRRDFFACAGNNRLLVRPYRFALGGRTNELTRAIPYGYFAQKREYTHTLRLESELSDLRVGYANPCAHADAVRFFDPARGIGKKKSTTFLCCP